MENVTRICWVYAIRPWSFNSCDPPSGREQSDACQGDNMQLFADLRIGGREGCNGISH